MTDYQETTCSCDECREMCKRPCWSSPDEARKMIDAGLSSKMMLDYWAGSPDIELVCPACPDHEGKDAPWWCGGKGCVLQTKDGLCSIHDSGFKPFEARMADCKQWQDDLHRDTAMMWDCDEGRVVVELWKREVGYGQEV